MLSIVEQRLLREVQVWAGVKHRNISPLLGIFFDVDRPRVPCLITPYHHHGDIARYIERHANIDKLGLVSDNVSVEELNHRRLSQITQTADGLSYLHGMDVIHGDIKGVSLRRALHSCLMQQV
jgi:serine/threonine protein kinase